ncbi:MAG TPA: SRPBCC family protein [Chloroflexota bacterium]|nr:SRPBCC family protein [Chloroflexota bacterium]
MAATLESRTLTVRIDRPLRAVYAFLSLPQNFPKWAAGLGTSIGLVRGEWIAETPQGTLRIRFSERNDFGILDHYVTLASGGDVYVPMRVIANGSGSEVLFTLFHLADMSDEQFAADARLVEQDLEALKRLLET